MASWVVEREGSLEEVDGALAALAARAQAAVRRRTTLSAVSWTCVGLAVLGTLFYASRNPMYPLVERFGPALLGLPPYFLFRFLAWLVTVPDGRRPDLARAVLAGLLLAPGSRVRLRIDLTATQRRANKVGKTGRGVEYGLDWLKLSATLADGVVLEVARRDEVLYSVSYGNRSTKYSWLFSFVDTVGLVFPRTLGAAAGLDIHLADQLSFPHGPLTRFDAGPFRAEVSVRSSTRWTAEEACGFLLGTLGRLYGLAGLPPPTRPRAPGAKPEAPEA